SPATSQDGVQIMTLHKAKGLEFDAVILPGLDRTTQSGEARPLRWKVREAQGRRTLMLAPLTSRTGADAQPDPVYAWLGGIDAAEEAAELGRLLYVGATRARHRLHLVAVGTTIEEDGAPLWKPPARSSALARLWRAVPARAAPPTQIDAPAGRAPTRRADAAPSRDRRD